MEGINVYCQKKKKNLYKKFIESLNDTSPRNSNVVPNHSCFPQCVSYRGIEELKELNVQDLNFDIRDNTNIIINKLIFTLKNDDFYNGTLHLCNSSIFYFNDRKINQLLI